MTAHQIVIQVEAVGINLWLAKSSDGRLAIAYDNAEKIKPFKKLITSHRDEVIAILKRRLPVPRKKIYSAIALEHALQWLVEMPDDADRLVLAPSSCRWLTGWLTPAKQREWQLNTRGGDDGQLPWRDWEQVIDLVRIEHEGVCEAEKIRGGANESQRLSQLGYDIYGDGLSCSAS